MICRSLYNQLTPLSYHHIKIRLSETATVKRNREVLPLRENTGGLNLINKIVYFVKGFLTCNEHILLFNDMLFVHFLDQPHY